ncbi:MAG: BatC protein [Chitinophagaceae bacterium]|nr:BatC protein [Chitinophagaceae bacterium]
MIVTYSAYSQKPNNIILKGNEAYRKQQFAEAEKNYREALQKNPSELRAGFNLGNTLYKEKKVDAATDTYSAVAEKTKQPLLRAQANYNLGTALANGKKLQEAITALKQSLRETPYDNDARENLQKAMNELKKQQQQQQKQSDNNDKKKNQDQQKQNQPQNQNKLSPQRAEQLLSQLQQQEKQIQKQLQKQKSPVYQQEKDW